MTVNKSRQNREKRIYLRQINIVNYKAIDHLEIPFIPPLMSNEPEVTVIGSKNGIGKTSILEACSWLFLAPAFDKRVLADLYNYFEPLNLPDLLIRSGQNNAEISAVFELDRKNINVRIKFTKSSIELSGDYKVINDFVLSYGLVKKFNISSFNRFVDSLLGGNAEPLLLAPFIYFHSYRKVQEGSIELRSLVEDDEFIRKPRPMSYRDRTTSTFKMEILRSMMANVGLFENLNDNESQETLNFLNDLIRVFAKGKIEKLRPTVNNSFEFRINFTDELESFSFDGLSSGQKEIISTLFLIWRYTKDRPGIVLIDEPELHLNEEWHRSFINFLFERCPNNQYIIATHSKAIFDSVDKEQRVTLEND